MINASRGANKKYEPNYGIIHTEDRNRTICNSFRCGFAAALAQAASIRGIRVLLRQREPRLPESKSGTRLTRRASKASVCLFGGRLGELPITRARNACSLSGFSRLVQMSCATAMVCLFSLFLFANIAARAQAN